jgi:hypothetical protein
MKCKLVYGNYIKADLQLPEEEIMNGCEDKQILGSAQKIGESCSRLDVARGVSVRSSC